MADLADIEKLAELRAKGLLTEGEYDARRKLALGLQRPRRRWRGRLIALVLIVAAFVGGIFFQDSFRKVNWKTAAASELDRSGIVVCSAPAVGRMLMEGAPVPTINGRPLALTLGPVQQSFNEEAIGIRQCTAPFMAGARQVGQASVWIHMVAPGRYETTVTQQVSTQNL